MAGCVCCKWNSVVMMGFLPNWFPSRASDMFGRLHLVPKPVYKFVTRPTALPVTKVTDRAIGLATNLVINIGHMIGETGLKVVQRGGFEALRKVIP